MAPIEAVLVTASMLFHICDFVSVIQVVVEVSFLYSPSRKSYLPTSYLGKLVKQKVTDNDTDL